MCSNSWPQRSHNRSEVVGIVVVNSGKRPADESMNGFDL